MHKLNSLRPHLYILAIIGLLIGFYMLFLAIIAPQRPPLAPAAVQPAQAPQMHLTIPAIGVSNGIVADDLAKLDAGYVVQRTGSGGNPETGGNFVLTGHRYVFSLDPSHVKKASVFYNLSKLKPGDDITVYWQHKRYRYQVSRLYEVKPTQVEIEQATLEDKLTIYTCTLEGAHDGRVVVEAHPVTQ